MKTIRLLALLALTIGSFAVSAQDAKTPAAGKPVPPTHFKNANAEEFDKFRADKNTVILDVRTPKEYAAGHIKGAVNIDFNAPDFDKKAGELDKSKTYLVHCAGGVRSSKACDKLGKLNFKCINLEGGLKAWEKAGKPVEK